MAGWVATWCRLFSYEILYYEREPYNMLFSDSQLPYVMSIGKGVAGSLAYDSDNGGNIVNHIKMTPWRNDGV
jgi:hypothetical protein